MAFFYGFCTFTGNYTFVVQHILFIMTFRNKYLLLLFIASAAFAQKGKEVTLKVLYTPQTTYRQAFVQKHTTTITYKANPDVLNVLKEQGIQNPTVQDLYTDYATETHTEKSLDGKVMPLTIRFVKAPVSFGKQGISATTKIYGHTETAGMPKVDSIIAPDLNQAFRQSLLATLDGMFSQMKFPDKPFGLGEVQQMTSPITLPLIGTTLDMDIITDYKFVALKGGIATFDLVITYKAKNPDPALKISAAGTGKGVMKYDTKKHFPLSQQSDIVMKIGFTYKEFDVDMTSDMHYDISATVVPDAR